MWKNLTSPRWISRLVALVGVLSVVSALAPPMRGRTHVLTEMVPTVFPQAATTATLAAGTLLVALSSALRRGKFRAWVVALVLSVLAAITHVVKGLDVEEAVLCLGMAGLLLAGRRSFTARPDPRSLRYTAGVAVLSVAVAGVLAGLWLAFDMDEVTDPTPGLIVLGAGVLLAILLTAMRPASGPHVLDADDEAAVRAVLNGWGDVDSLSYFATRADRQVIFSPSGKAAVSYRTVGAVSLAAGDPLGDPEAWPGAIDSWLERCRSLGWTPAVLGASENAALAYKKVGLDALELGDEAIIDVPTFTLEGRSMRVVRQAVSRCSRAGLVATCHRVGSLSPEVLAEVRHHAAEWRDGDVERGFSMALDRHADPRDPDAMLVLTRDADGELHGLLSLVPWGMDGLSLDLMRRRRDSQNGVVELMVTALVDHARSHDIRRLSLNFAVFRSVFARGERIGAGPVLRLWHVVLLGLSRFWQIESLYRANAKYHPEWVPRFLCFASPADLPRVATAALRAEAFL